MNVFNRFLRRLVPSVAKLTYQPLFRVTNIFSRCSHLLFPELKRLPPAHLRARVGVGNHIIFNQISFLRMGEQFWMSQLLEGRCSTRSNIVELGCGCGRMLRPLHDNPAYVGNYYGIDIDAEMLSWCTKHLTRPNFTFLRSPHVSRTYACMTQSKTNFWTIPIAAESIDFAFSMSLFTHLMEEEVRNYLLETARLLRSGGTAKMSFFSIDSVKLGGRWTFQHKVGNAFVENVQVPEAAVAYETQFMLEMAREAGFSDCSVAEAVGQSMLCLKK